MVRALWRPAAAVLESGSEAAADGERLNTLLRAHYADIWRVLRRLGLQPASVEDAAQQVFVIATTKLSRIEPGKERAFLIGTATRVAANLRRGAAARHECQDDDLDRRLDDAPGAEELLHEKRLRALLDDVLDTLPSELRTVLVLFELEELDVAEIAEAIGIPRGTAASRLRRAREAFERAARRVRARYAFTEDT